MASLLAWAIALIVIGAILIFFVILVCIYMIHRCSRKKPYENIAVRNDCGHDNPESVDSSQANV